MLFEFSPSKLVFPPHSGVRVPHRAGWYLPGEIRFRPRAVAVVDVYGRISYPGMGLYPRRERRDLDVGPRGNSSRALTP